MHSEKHYNPGVGWLVAVTRVREPPTGEQCSHMGVEPMRRPGSSLLKDTYLLMAQSLQIVPWTLNPSSLPTWQSLPSCSLWQPVAENCDMASRTTAMPCSGVM